MSTAESGFPSTMPRGGPPPRNPNTQAQRCQRTASNSLTWSCLPSSLLSSGVGDHVGEINNQCSRGAETQCGADAGAAASSPPEVALRSLPETVRASAATA